MCDNPSQDDREECQQKQWLRTGVTVALSLWFINLVLAAYGWAMDKGNEVSQFGDSFGAVNALFSSVAVAGAVYAVILQQRELALTREEMRLARTAHEESADAQERMAAIQGHSTMLSDLTQEIDYLRGRRDAAREGVRRFEYFLRYYKEAMFSRNLDSEVQKKGAELLQEAEALGVWSMRDYTPGTTYREMTFDLEKAFDNLKAEKTAIVGELMDAQSAKTHTIGQLKEAMAAKKEATA